MSISKLSSNRSSAYIGISLGASYVYCTIVSEVFTYRCAIWYVMNKLINLKLRQRLENLKKEKN